MRYKLEDLCSKITDGSHYSPSAQSGGFPMLSVKDMEEFGFSYASCKFISSEDFQKMKINDCIPQKNDILLAKDGSVLKHIFVYSDKKEEAILSSIAIFRPNTKIVNPTFLCYTLKSPKVFRYISENCVSGSALPRIVLKDFKRVEIDIPNLEVQNQIIRILVAIDEKRKTNQKINDNLAA